MTKRLFFGTYCDSNIFKSIYSDLKEDFDYCCKGKWVEPENLHFTYKFLGDTDINLIPKIIEGLNEVLKEHESSLIYSGLGVFPNIQRPNVLHVKIINSDSVLLKLNDLIEKVCGKYGFERESRKFSPHLTLQRIKTCNDLEEFKELLLDYKDFQFGTMTKFRINLIESKLTPKGPIYSIIK